MAAKAKGVQGIVSVRMQPLEGRVLVRYDPGLISPELVAAAMKDIIDSIDH